MGAEGARDRSARGAAANDDDLTDRRQVASGEPNRPLARRLRRSDQHNAIALLHDVATARNDDVVGADQRGDDALVGHPELGDASTHDVLGRICVHLELHHLRTTIGEEIGLQGARHTDCSGDSLGDLVFGRDHRVHRKLAGAPSRKILSA